MIIFVLLPTTNYHLNDYYHYDGDEHISFLFFGDGKLQTLGNDDVEILTPQQFRSPLNTSQLLILGKCAVLLLAANERSSSKKK